MELPVIDLEPYLDVVSGKHSGDEVLNPQLKLLCSEVSQTLRETGALLIIDPRCSAQDNDRFIDMMEKYFEQPDEFKRLQERPLLHYQVGVTPEGTEVPRSFVEEEMQKTLQSLPIESQPLIPTGPDPKWRYKWQVGPRLSTTKFQELNFEPVIPEGFPEWKETMDTWGSRMISAIEAVAEMAAIGFGLPKDAFTGLMKHGPHLLVPTGSNLKKHGKVGTVLAGYHYDLNFLTIHGRSRFPGLSIWLRNGKKVEVKVPVGCLLIQTGKQIELLTAGDCLAGMHEVVVTSRTLDAIKTASQENRSLWRVSSTLYSHIASDAVLKPLGHFAQSPISEMLSNRNEFIDSDSYTAGEILTLVNSGQYNKAFAKVLFPLNLSWLLNKVDLHGILKTDSHQISELVLTSIFRQLSIEIDRDTLHKLSLLRDDTETLQKLMLLRDIFGVLQMTGDFIDEVKGGAEERMLSLLSSSQSCPPHALSSSVSCAQQRYEISSLLNSGEFKKAFSKCYFTGDLPWLCKEVDLQRLLTAEPPVLSQIMLFAVLRQLSLEIHDDMYQKLCMIRDVLVFINMSDVDMLGTVHKELRQVRKNLKGVVPVSASEKICLRVVQMLLKSQLEPNLYFVEDPNL